MLHKKELDIREEPAPKAHLHRMRSERLRTRESLTRALTRIAGRIAEAPTRLVEWNDRYLYSRVSSTITAKRLWAAGSFARGATMCGDLDLILEIDVDGAHPPTRTIGNGLFGRAQDTSLFIGTPEQNTSNIAFPEARLIWSEASPDWNANIAAIAPDPTAGRFARPADRLPFRPDQMSASIEELDRLLELRDQGVLSWEFVDAAEIDEDRSALKNAGIASDHYGAKTRDALRLGISCLVSRGRKADQIDPEADSRTCFRYGGTLLLTAQPALPIDLLRSPLYDRLALVPHRSRRGPNGVWLIGRGPEHPLEKQFADCRAFYVTWDGQPAFFSDVSYSEYEPANGIELFLAEEDAVDRAEDDRDFVADGEGVGISSAAGTELLQLVAGCDLVLVDFATIALSRLGELAAGACGEDEVVLSGALELAAALQTRSPEV
jgi:hypothetical protein